MAGTLYLCATPIGNLEDITLRVLRILKEVDVIAAEDTRQSVKLLNHYGISTPLVSYHEHNKREKTPLLVRRLLEGEDLVRACYEAGVEVTSLPGASAVVTALALSGMKARRFTFEGFLPVDKKERVPVLERLKQSDCTAVFYEAPHRLIKTLHLLAETVGNDRRAAVCKELTKKHEMAQHFTLGEAVSYYEEHEPRGEFVLVIEGADPEELRRERELAWKEIPLQQHMEKYLAEGMDKKTAMKAVAKDRGVSRREIYAALLENG